MRWTYERNNNAANKCCFCCHIRTGTLIFGLVHLVSGATYFRFRPVNNFISFSHSLRAEYCSLYRISFSRAIRLTTAMTFSKTSLQPRRQAGIGETSDRQRAAIIPCPRLTSLHYLLDCSILKAPTW
jgi:hypothetical protein